MIHSLLKSKSIPETDKGIEFEIQCRVNHGPEWNVEISIPIQTPNSMHFTNLWALEMSGFTKQHFLI